MRIFAHINTDKPRHLGFNPVRFAYWRNGHALWRGDGPGSFRTRATPEQFLTALETLDSKCTVTTRHAEG